MMGEVLEWRGETLLDIDPDKVLKAAIGKEHQYVLLIGLDKDGEFFVASSESDMLKANFYAAKFQHKLQSGDYG